MDVIYTPLYRAKKIDSDEYVIGHYCVSKSGIDLEFTNHVILPFLNLKEHEVCQTDYENIDISTLSIHFPTMVDSKGTKLFASLNKNGIGGDKVFHEEELQTFVLEFDFISGVSMYEHLYNDDGSFYCKNFVKKFNCNSIFETYTFAGIK